MGMGLRWISGWNPGDLFLKPVGGKTATFTLGKIQWAVHLQFVDFSIWM